MHNKTTQILGEIKYATAWPILKQKEEFFWKQLEHKNYYCSATIGWHVHSSYDEL